MSGTLAALVADARSVRAEQRGALAERLRQSLAARPGSVLLETCHRVELYGHETSLSTLGDEQLPNGVRLLTGRDVAHHLLRVAVGRESAVVAEDQLLHQFRTAVQKARAEGTLSPELDRLCDVALRAGRRARSWLPARRPTLADVALDRVLECERSRGSIDLAARPVLVVGSGEMGRLAARSVVQRGIPLAVTSRTPERAAGLAGRLNVRTVPFDPGPDLAGVLRGAVVALSGPWALSADTQAALAASGGWLIDLSAPSWLPDELARRLGPRLLTIDALATLVPAGQPSAILLQRLDRLVEAALAEYESWSARESQRNAARALARKADAAQAAELDALWQRMPQLEAEQRQEVERMARHLTERLLRDPLERLQQDGDDGRHATAARELFRL